MQGVGDMTGAARPHSLIRAFSMRREWRLATDPLHVMAESPDVCHHGGTPCSPKDAEKMRRDSLKGVCVGIFFGREMLKRSGVPQGLICTAHGGTSMEQWSPERKRLGGESLYASMVESVRATGQPVAGLLWYQGESDANPDAAPQYTRRMQKLVAASRRDLGHAKLPWIIVQLARFFSTETNFAAWNNIQEQERSLPKKIKYFETVAAIDLPMDDHIHVGSKGFVTLGQRMARVADRMVYGNRKEKGPPRLREIRKNSTPLKTTIEVVYDDVVGPLRSDGEASGHMLVTPGGTALPLIYKTTLHRNSVELAVQGPISKDLRLHYGHGYAPRCNITDGRGFSLPVFGPSDIGKNKAGEFLPFVTQWKVTGIIAATEPLDKIACPDVDHFGGVVKTYGLNGFAYGLDGFINEWPTWQGKSGQAYFQARLHLEEPMKLLFLMGYDGPFKLWLDGKPFFTDMKGINPCLPDKSRKEVALDRGSHDLRIGMDLHGGQAWGFLLRFRRQDVSRGQIRTGHFAKPGYSA